MRAPSPTDAVVLAAGEGSRLRPLTRYQPKPMLPLANRPVIEYVLSALADTGVERAVIVVGHRRTHVQDRLGHEHDGMELSYVLQRSQLGSGHALKQAADDVGEEFVVANGDNVIDARMVRRTVEAFREGSAVASVAVAHSETPQDYGVICTDEGTVTSIDEGAAVDEPTSVNAGVYALTDAVFDSLDGTETQDGELHLTDGIKRLSGRVVASRPDSVWFDPSYPWDVLRAMSHLLSNHPELIDAEEAVDASASVHEGAVVERPALVGPGCEIGAGTVVGGGSCLRENVRVGPNATIERSIVDTDATVGANTVIRDSILGPGVHVGSGTVSPGGSATLVVDGRQYRDRRLGGVIADRARIGGNVTIAPGTRIGPSATVPHGATVDGDVAERTEVVA
jgi:glucose-1-phosphate thymidylyltransferase